MAKTTPTSIRFDEDQLAFIKNKEKIDSPQKVVNFLLNLYWWQHNYTPPYMQESKYNPDKGIISPTSTTCKVIEITQYEAYISEIKGANSLKDIKTTMKEINNDKSITASEKIKLEQFAKEISKNLDV